MRISRSYLALVAGLCVSAAANVAHAQDQCGDVLRGGLFNSTSVTASSAVETDYNAWLCTTEFRTHQEAHNSGVAVGFPVYGVPVQIGAQFDSATRDAWKKAHCQQASDHLNFSKTYSKVVSEVSDKLVSAWRDCMVSLYGTRVGLSGVALSHGPKLVSVRIRWAPYDQFDNRLPKVTGYSVVGAKQVTVGSALFKVSSNVPATETSVDFERTSVASPVVITLNTDRGSIPLYVPPQTMRVNMVATLTPTVEQRRVNTRDYEWYQHTPQNDCVRDMNFDENYYPPTGYSFTSYWYEETTKNGNRTSYSSNPIANGVHFHMHVQGDDGAFGFCKNSGWLGLKIHVQGEQWVPMSMKEHQERVSGQPLQETLTVKYPYLTPSADVRNPQFSWTANVELIIGDEVRTIQLSPALPSAGDVSAAVDVGGGKLALDATKAFKAWRATLTP